MADNNSFKDTVSGWMDKAEGFLDSMLEKSAGYKEQVSSGTRQLDDLARASKEDVHEEMKQAREHLKEQAKEISDRLDSWIDEVKQRAGRTGDVSDEQLDRFRRKAERIKEEINQDTDNISDELRGHAERFVDGLDRIRHDIKENEAAGNRRVNETSPITGHGDYRAADVDGTLNNYADRMETHTEMTRERIRERAEEAEQDILEKATELGIKEEM